MESNNGGRKRTDKGDIGMSEKIIVDGVDVAECEFVERFCTLTLQPQAVCKIYRHYTDNSECYYKQLQRAKEENQEQVESIKKLIKYYTSENTKLNRKYEKLKESTKLLKKNYKTCHTWLNEIAESNDELQKVYQSEHIDNLNYKQALEEIREIAKEPCIKGEDCSKCEINCLFKDILNKISEAKNDI